MKNHGIIAAIILFALIIVGMFIFAFLKKSELTNEPIVVDPVVVETTPYDSITRIDAKHYYVDGVHTIVGEILMPTQCDLLNWESATADFLPETVNVQFTVINNADNCTQAVIPARFYVPFTASEGAAIKATLNGRSVELNLIPAAEGEKPEDFELYIKG